jgi:hypothetical protein
MHLVTLHFPNTYKKYMRNFLMLKHDIKFVILTRTSCVRMCYPPQKQTRHVVQPSYGLSQHASINPLNANWNTICQLLALFGARHILHVSRIRVNANSEICISHCSLYSSDQKYLTHKCLDTSCGFFTWLRRTNLTKEFHCFTMHFNSLYIMVQLMHFFVMKH